MIVLTIPGKPIAKKRPRFARRGTYVAVINDQQTEEGRVLYELQQQYTGAPVTDPVSVRMTYYMPIPKSTSKRKRESMELNLIVPDKKPDLDNMIKFYLDCIQPGVIADDKQVYSIRAVKQYSENPRTEIVIT